MYSGRYSCSVIKMFRFLDQSHNNACETTAWMPGSPTYSLIGQAHIHRQKSVLRGLQMSRQYPRNLLCTTTEICTISSDPLK